MALIGPLGVDAGVAYTAPYLETIPAGFLIRQLMRRMHSAPPDGGRWSGNLVSRDCTACSK